MLVEEPPHDAQAFPEPRGAKTAAAARPMTRPAGSPPRPAGAHQAAIRARTAPFRRDATWELASVTWVSA
jgi:hypothetical protein